MTYSSNVSKEIVSTLSAGLPTNEGLELYLDKVLPNTFNEWNTPKDLNIEALKSRIRGIVSNTKVEVINLLALSRISRVAFRIEKNKAFPAALAKGFNLINESNNAKESVELYFDLKFASDFRIVQKRYQTEECETTVKWMLQTKLERFVAKNPDRKLNAGFFTTSLNNMMLSIKRTENYQRRNLIFVENEKITSYSEHDPWTLDAEREVQLKIEAGLQIIEDLATNHKNPHWFHYLLEATNGVKYANIAEKYDVPIGSVMSALNRARKILREKLEESQAV